MKSAFVTGANQGLGYAFVQDLLGKGWRVFGGTRKLPLDLPNHENLVWIQMDVSDNDSIAKAVAKIQEYISELNLLINNAGVNKDTGTNNHKELVTDLATLDRETLLRMFDINAIAPMLVLQKFLPLLTDDPSFVINISSCRGSFHDRELNTQGNYGYRASKVALNMLTTCSLFDLPKNVKTFAVHPGNLRSKMNPTGGDDPKVQADKIVSITTTWDETKNGMFLNFDGAPYPL